MRIIIITPQEGLEPTTNRLTADRSTTELLRNLHKRIVSLKQKKNNINIVKLKIVF